MACLASAPLICAATWVFTIGRIESYRPVHKGSGMSDSESEEPVRMEASAWKAYCTLADLDEAPVGTKGWIYVLRFPNGKVYVGQTESWKRRMRGHKCGSKHDDGFAVKRAIRKYGWKNVVVEVLDEVDLSGATKCQRREKLNGPECFWIAKMRSRIDGYNETDGGDAQPMDDPVVALRQKERIGQAMRRPEVRAKKRALWQDSEYREMQRGLRNSPEALDKRRKKFSRKREAKLRTMTIEQGRAFMRNNMEEALKRARRTAERVDDVYGRDVVKEMREFYVAEIAGYEAGIWRTPASSASGEAGPSGGVEDAEA